jgi:galactokinase
MNELHVSTPGRICLFGEHQDYLHLPIIAAAISKRIYIKGRKRNDRKIVINLPDINQREEFLLTERIPYIKERDYFRSAVNLLHRDGFNFSFGCEATITGDIPINAGTSSSSALVNSWINFLAQMSDQKKNLLPETLADLSYRAEVLEFSEPGGMMDHYSTAIGGVIYLSSFPNVVIKKLSPKLGAFILGNSSEPKDTKAILARVKYGVLKIIDYLKKSISEFNLHLMKPKDISNVASYLDKSQLELFVGTVANKLITEQALQVLKEKIIDHNKFGQLLNEHHKILRDNLKISTPKIDRMIDAALKAGALGAKINGSGGGGCMFAYAPHNPEVVLEEVKKIAPDSHIVYVDKGTYTKKDLET